MKFHLRDKKIISIMLIVVIICLILTGIIVGSLAKEASAKAESYWFFRESVKTGQPVTIRNAYLVSEQDGQLVFVHEGNTYEIKGELETPINGVADIVVDGEDIVKIYAKPDVKEGVLESYTDSSLCLADQNGEMQNINRNDSIPVYRIDDEQIWQEDWNSFIVGVSKIDCVMENGKVCAILIEEDVLPTDIRVVIKNGSQIFHEDLYIKNLSDESLINVNALLDEKDTALIEISDEKGLFLCNSTGEPIDEAFEGSFRIIKTENGLVLVNELPIENYLKYVVPSEMPLAFGEEALKAQAVCARTYAYAQMYNQTYAMYGANLDDTTAYQVYHNTGRFTETDAAVEATKGEVITKNGKLINSLYFSTHPKDENSPFSSWSAYLDMSKAIDSELGALKDIKIIEKNKDGFATEIKLIFEDGTRSVANEYTIRKEIGRWISEIVLSNESVRTDISTLPSSYFTVNTTKDGDIYLKGAGYGHGIGMSQYGAKAMAEAGYTYKEIIEYYYEDVTVKTQ